MNNGQTQFRTELDRVAHEYFSLRRMGVRPAGAWRSAMQRSESRTYAVGCYSDLMARLGVRGL